MDINKVFFNAKESTSLIRAMVDGDAEESLVRCLIENGADINKTDCYGQTPLMLASQYGDLGTVKLLIKEQMKQISDRRSIFKFDINAKDEDGMTALDFAKNNRNEKSRKEIMKFLREHGAKTGKEIDH